MILSEVRMSSGIKILLSALILISSTAWADVLLKDTQGHNISFSSLKGKWVLINYWASWCQSCVEEIPELNRFYRQHEKDSIALFAVNYDGLPLSKQISLIKKFNILYPSLSTDPALALGLEDIAGVPVTFVFNPQGELAETLYGGQDLRSLEQVVAKK